MSPPTCAPGRSVAGSPSDRQASRPGLDMDEPRAARGNGTGLWSRSRYEDAPCYRNPKTRPPNFVCVARPRPGSGVPRSSRRCTVRANPAPEYWWPCVRRRRVVYMKTMIDIDDQALELAARELGTTTKKDTVNAALQFVANRRRRIEQLLDDPYALGVGPDITNPEIMRQARR